MTPRRFQFALARALVACFVLVLLAGPALAHKMKLFATAEGAQIVGSVYFSGGTRAAGVTVTATDRSGVVRFTGTTDAGGGFRFEATVRADHVITASGEDGHAARFTVSAAELPDGLPLPAAPEGASASPGAASPATAPASSSASCPGVLPASADASGLRALVDQSVAQHLRPLREQLDAWHDEVWWHDVVGGIGYIIGLGGLAFGLARRKTAR